MNLPDELRLCTSGDLTAGGLTDGMSAGGLILSILNREPMHATASSTSRSSGARLIPHYFPGFADLRFSAQYFLILSEISFFWAAE